MFDEDYEKQMGDVNMPFKTLIWEITAFFFFFKLRLQLHLNQTLVNQN